MKQTAKNNHKSYLQKAPKRYFDTEEKKTEKNVKKSDQNVEVYKIKITPNLLKTQKFKVNQNLYFYIFFIAC